MKSFNSRLLQKTSLSKRVIRFKFTKPSNFSFKEGQFVFIEIPNTKIRRAYSIASSNNEEFLEFIVDVSPMGIATSYLHSMSVGDSLFFNGPWGHMALPSNLANSDLCFVATGTGIAPFVSILKFLEENNYSGNVQVIYSEKYQVDLINLDFSLKNFKKILCITRENNLFSKDLLRGRVTEYLDNVSTNSHCFICGNKSMILAVKEALVNKGVSDISLEVFY